MAHGHSSVFARLQDATPRFRAALARAAAGGTVARVLFVGDSNTAGYAPAGQIVPSTGRAAAQMVTQLDALPRWSGKVVKGLQRWSNAAADSGGSNPTNELWTLGAGWTTYAGFGWGEVGLCGCTNQTTTTTYGPVSCDGFRVLYGTSSFGTANAANLNIDGGSTLSTLNCNNATGLYKEVTVTASSYGSHTLNIVARNPGQLYILAVEPITNSAQLSIGHAGVSSSSTVNWVSTGAVPNLQGYKAIAAATPDLVVLNLGLNDRNNGVSLATFKANLTTIANAVFGVNGDVVFVIPNDANMANNSLIPDYNAAITEVAQSLNCAIVNLYQYGTTGRSTDNIHLNTAGQLQYALDVVATAML